jgi:Flp pilus assembly protein TadD
LAPYIAASAAFAILTIVSQSRELQGGRVDWHGGGPLATFFTMVPVMATYVRMVFWPSGLSAIYDPVIRESFLDATVLLSLLLIVTVLGGMIFWWRKFPKTVFWGWFGVIMIAPVCQVVPIITLINDRYLYFPFAGIAVAIALGGSQLFERFSARAAPASLFRFLCAAVIIALAAASANRAEIWSDPQLFWADTVSKAPGHPFARFGLGSLYSEIGKDEEAAREYETLLSLPGLRSLPPTIGVVPETHARLGVFYALNGEPDRGVAHLRRAVSLCPDCISHRRDLGFALASAREFREARDVLEGIVKLDPRDITALCFMSGLSLKLGDAAGGNRYREAAAAIDLQAALQECGRTYVFLDGH